MARQDATVQQVADEGIAPSFVAAHVDGHQYPNDGESWIEVKNTSGSPVNVTVQTGGTLAGEPVSDKVVSVPATTGDRIIGPFPPVLYNRPDGLIWIDTSAQSGVTIGFFHL